MLYLSDDMFAACRRLSLSFIFFANFLAILGFGQHLFVVADKTLLLLNLLSFHAVFGIYHIAIFVFFGNIKFIWLYNEHPCHNLYFFLLYILFVFLYFCYWLFNLQNSRKVFLFSRFLLKLLWLEQMFATAFNPGLTRMWERVVRITSKTDLSAFSCLLLYSL